MMVVVVGAALLKMLPDELGDHTGMHIKTFLN